MTPDGLLLETAREVELLWLHWRFPAQAVIPEACEAVVREKEERGASSNQSNVAKRVIDEQTLRE